MAFLVMIFEWYNCEATITDNKVGEIDGYSYELKKDVGTAYMNLNGGGKFSCEWSNVNYSTMPYSV